jgi:hypothetical protein
MPFGSTYHPTVLLMKKRGRRPQSAGWEKAVKRALKPEHVERLSDTEVQITLPPVTEFDIEDDEIVEVWIPPSMLVKATEPLFAGRFTIKADSFKERIDNALQGLDEECAELGPRSKLAAFLLTFFTCEIVAKALVSHAKYGPTGRKALGDKWSTRDIAAAPTKLGVAYKRSELDPLFATEPKVASEMSARALRDSIAHRMKRVHRQAVRDRYLELMERMEGFLTAVRMWRGQSIPPESQEGPPIGTA